MGFVCLTYANPNRASSKFTTGETIFQAVSIQDSLKVDGDQLTFITKINKENIQVSYKIKSKSEKERLLLLRYGEVLYISGTFTIPEESRNTAQFDYRGYLAKNGIHYLLKVEDLQLTSIKKIKPTFYLANWRLRLSHFLEQRFTEQPMSAYMEALLIGEKSHFNPDMYQSYQKMGVIHLLAISGLHVNLFFGALYYLFIRLGIIRERAANLICVLLPFYIALVGFNAPAVRACLMLFLMLLFNRKKKVLSALSILFLTFIICFLISPNVLYQVGFQLSYFVSFTILLSSKVILKQSQNVLKTSFMVSFLASFSSSIIMMYHFYEFSIIGIFLNLFYVPFFSFCILPSCVLSFLTCMIPLVNVVTKSITLICIQISEWGAGLFQSISLPTIVTGRPSLFWLLLLLFVFIITLAALERRRHFIKFLALYSSLLFLLKVPLTGQISFIDVGQGDSILIQLPFFAGNYLIDTGGGLPLATKTWQKKRKPFSVADTILIPTLKAKGISKLDKVFITHSHADHMEALPKLAQQIKVNELIIPSGAEQKAIMDDALQRIPNDVKVTKVLAPNSIKPFQILAPTTKVDGENVNNGSLVIRAQLDGLMWLFTGDIEEEAEEKLLNKQIQADVLKVAHHGSKTSSSKKFLEAVKPRVAIISCGKNNRFKHPNVETLSSLTETNTQIMRTDELGEITYIFGYGFHSKLK